MGFVLTHISLQEFAERTYLLPTLDGSDVHAFKPYEVCVEFIFAVAKEGRFILESL